MQDERVTKRERLIPVIKQFFKFGIVGISNTLISLGVYYLLLLINVHYIVANIIAFLVSVINAFYWNSKYVFPKGAQDRKKSFIKCFAAYGFTFILGTFLLYLMVDKMGISDKIAPIINLCITVPINFVMNKLWAFKETKIKFENAEDR